MAGIKREAQRFISIVVCQQKLNEVAITVIIIIFLLLLVIINKNNNDTVHKNQVTWWKKLPKVMFKNTNATHKFKHDWNNTLFDTSTDWQLV